MPRENPGPPEWAGGGGGGGGGKPPGAGVKKGDLYGDQYVFERDLDPNDNYDDPTPGDGDGEVILDGNENPILLGSDGDPIYYEMDETGSWVLDPDRADFAVTVDLGRANVARAPDSVMTKSLNSAIAKIDAATDVTTDAAGRIVCDGVTIDSPLENLALYKALMTSGGESSWPEVTDNWDDAGWSWKLLALVGDTTNPNWDPSSLLGAAFDKAAPISLDAVLTENTVLGINTVTTATDNIGNPIVDYFEFNDGTTETYNHVREAKYSDTYVTWLADDDEDGTFEYVDPVSVYDAVFGGTEWVDANRNAGADDFAQAVDDARAVIAFMHDQLGAMEVLEPGSDLLLA